MTQVINKLKMTVEAKASNESFCRAAVAAFCAVLDPTIEELNDIKTAVSEAVTNCIVHAYPLEAGLIYITVELTKNGRAIVRIKDKGKGIENVELARQPLYTSLGGDRSGLGFSVMETFTDKLSVRSAVGRGTTVVLEKQIWGRLLQR